MKISLKNNILAILICIALVLTGCEPAKEHAAKTMGIETAHNYKCNIESAQIIFRNLLLKLRDNLEQKHEIKFHTTATLIDKTIMRFNTKIRPTLAKHEDLFKPYLLFTLEYNFLTNKLKYILGTYTCELYFTEEVINNKDHALKLAEAKFKEKLTETFQLAIQNAEYSGKINTETFQVDVLRTDNTFTKKKAQLANDNKNENNLLPSYANYDIQFYMNIADTASERLLSFILQSTLKLVEQTAVTNGGFSILQTLENKKNQEEFSIKPQY